MMKKMMKSAIAVALTIAVGGVLIPTNLQNAKPEVQAAASVKGTWTLIDTEYHQPENYIKSYDSGNYYRIEFGEPKELDNGDVQLFVSRYHSWTSPKGSCETLSTSVCSAPNSSYKSDEVAYLNESITSQFTGIFITSIKNALIHKRTEKLAFTDPLTELYNHRFFQETLLQEFTRSQRYKKPLSLMIIDIDFFKKFNDTYGHLVGDKVLKHVSAIFKSSMREQIDTEKDRFPAV